MAIELYVYYRVAPTQAATLRQRVRNAHEALQREHPGLVARVLRRPPVGDGDHTWMEVYAMAAADAPPLDAMLQARIEGTVATALGDGLLRSPRHVEVFETA
jgi:hypothetical protein